MLTLGQWARALAKPGQFRAGVLLAILFVGLAGCDDSKDRAARRAALHASPSGSASDGSGGVGDVAPVELTGKPLSTAEIVARCEPSVALIKGKVSSGTGFLIGPGLVATNAHVLDDEFLENLEVRFPSAQGAQMGPFPAELLSEDVGRDLALLSVKVDLPPLVLADDYRFQKGEDVTVIGNPGLGDGKVVLENAISRGVMSTRAQLDGNDFYQLNIAINAGNSGGPVFESTGRVVGVATLKASRQESVAFCIPETAVREARDHLQSRKYRPDEPAQARHRTVAAFKRLTIGGALLAIALDIRRVERETGQAISVESDGKTMNGQEFTAKLADIDAKVSDGLAPAVARVQTDTSQETTARARIGELMANHEAMKASLGQALDNGRINAMKDTHRRLIDEEKAALNVDVPQGLMIAFKDHDPSESLGAFAGNSRFGMGPGGLHTRMMERHQQMMDRHQENMNRSMQRQQDSMKRMNDMRSRMLQRRMGPR